MKKDLVVRRLNARSFMEGQEHCREYFHTDKITFGSSTLPVGYTGATDPGHDGAHEIFYVSRGHVLVHVGAPGYFYELEEGDAVFLPENEPHTITNVGEETAVVVWACAPTHIEPSAR